MTKSVKIIPPEEYEVDKERSTLEEIVFKKKSKLPEKWEELETIQGYRINLYGCITGATAYKLDSVDRGIYSSRELAEASLAIAQLSQLREVARDGWVSDWITRCNKYCIGFALGIPHILHTSQRNHFLSFQSKEIAEEFLEKYRGLIEQARPILGG